MIFVELVDSTFYHAMLIQPIRIQLLLLNIHDNLTSDKYSHDNLHHAERWGVGDSFPLHFYVCCVVNYVQIIASMK